MAKRVRLTQRLRQRRAAGEDIPYPGTVNQPDRKFPTHEQYHTFEQRVNHELPDMRHDWQSDERDDIGFGIAEPWGASPTVASVRVAANKAVRLAILLLGEKTPEGVIEAQARDFMALGNSAMDRTLSRFAKTQSLYASDELSTEHDEAGADEGEEKKASKTRRAEDEKKEEEAVADEGEEKKASKTRRAEEEKKEEAGADEGEEKKASKTRRAQDEDEEEDDDDEEAEEAEEADEAEEEEAEGEEEEATEASAKSRRAVGVRKNPNELDIQLTGSADEVEPDLAADARLQAALFGGDADLELPPVRKASGKKAGVSKLGGQPKVASNAGSAPDISDIWNGLDAPDVSGVFN